jgi:hypothetical protein
MAAVSKLTLFVYTTLHFFTPYFPFALLFPFTLHHPMLHLSNDFGHSTGLNAIDPALMHASSPANWTFPENHHQRSISAAMGSSVTTPYASVSDHCNIC